MTKDTWLPLLGLACGLALSFLGVGLMWIGLPIYVQPALGALFLAVALLLARSSRSFAKTAFTLGAGAAPLALLFVQFRDREDSHLYPMLLVASWYVSTAIGAWIGSRLAAKAQS